MIISAESFYNFNLFGLCLIIGKGVDPRAWRHRRRSTPGRGHIPGGGTSRAGAPRVPIQMCYCACPMIFALDLEGVLAPEIWPILGTHFELPELSFTTRDVGDFDELMHRRVAATRSRNIKLRDLQAISHGVEPYLGARDFLARLRTMGQVVIISSDVNHEAWMRSS